MRLREGPVSPLHDGRHSLILKEINEALRGEVLERGAEHIGIGPDVRGEGSPILEIGEIASSLACNDDFPARSRHLLQHQHGQCRIGRPGPDCCHKAGGTASYDNNVVMHIEMIDQARHPAA